MSHPFGNFIKRHLSRKHGLSQTKLAEAVYVDPAVITRMCQGRGLNRDRILDIIVWFYEQAVFSSVDEANALLQAAGLAELNSEQPREMEILCRLRKETQQLASSEKRNADYRLLDNRKGRRIRWDILAIVVPVMLAPFLIWMVTKPKPPVWQEDFNPLNSSQWSQVSARWEDVPGSTARLIESNPDEVFGKVESEIITANVDAYPFLRISVTALDLDSSYTIQILDKRTALTKDVLSSIAIPGVHQVNLAQEMGWEGKGVQSFTINIWIGGEGASITFVLVRIGND